MTTVASRKSSHQTTLLSSLPQEIIDIIATTHLTPQELAHCLCVSHEWFDAFTPSLWRAIRVVDETIYDRFRTKETRDALARNSHHIRVVETTDPTFAFFLATLPSTTPTNLRSLTLRLLKAKQQFAFSTDDLIQQQCQEALITMMRTMISATVTQLLLLRNRNLHVLILDEGCFRNEIGDKTDLFFKVLAAVPSTHLERLEISFMGAQPRDNSRVGATLDARDRYREEFMEAIHLHADKGLFLALREVAISGANDTIMDHTRLSFLVRCPNVERIRLDRLDLPSAITIPLMLKNTCPKLTCLDLNDGNSIRLERVLDSVDLVRATALGWRELRLPDMPQFGASAFEALMESVETLEVLRIEGAGQLGTNAVLNLLCSAKNLRRLEGVGDGRREVYTKELTVFAKSAYLEYCNGGEKGRSSRQRLGRYGAEL
ncbi:hypothetical protein BGZ97_010633 [Linnemannia gamsii]|uniref:F-box domain-containing protein n=1 Tax=Linnemannia gamsii TaxID=64522 RepID=A0A9P6UUN9_9FUNG|nr:hypothetical protein BGZ97_010633 [Linnemannia gamsii]